MKAVRVIRRLASLILLVCLALPLSKCDVPNGDEYTGDKSGVTAEANADAGAKPDVPKSKDNVLWGYEAIAPSIEFGDDYTYEDYFGELFSSLPYVALLLGPILLAPLKDRVQSVLTLLCALPAAYCLVILLTLSQPLVGAWLALMSWVALLITNSILLVKDRSS
jgi:hypothetical protein